MRAVFINQCHPNTPHICGTRVREFAKSMATRGHEIILLTETLNSSYQGDTVDNLDKKIRAHDFSYPFHIAASPIESNLLKLVRGQNVFWGIRRPIIYWAFKCRYGLFFDWRQGCQPFLNWISNNFRPDVVWSTFGNTDCWNIAQDLANKSQTNWVADIKDSWEDFIPKRFWHTLAKRYHDAKSMTTLSEFHKTQSALYFPADKSVLYSGFDNSYIDLEKELYRDDIVISLTGSTYAPKHLDDLLTTISSWVKEKNTSIQRRFKLVYAGPAENEVKRAIERTNFTFNTEIRSYISLNEYFKLLQSCKLNMYIKNERTFHHKIFELLAVGNPVLCFPKESQETLKIVKNVDGNLFSCDDLSDVLDAMNSVLEDTNPGITIMPGIADYTWDKQVIVLEKALYDAINN